MLDEGFCFLLIVSYFCIHIFDGVDVRLVAFLSKPSKLSSIWSFPLSLTLERLKGGTGNSRLVYGPSPSTSVFLIYAPLDATTKPDELSRASQQFHPRHELIQRHPIFQNHANAMQN